MRIVGRRLDEGELEHQLADFHHGRDPARLKYVDAQDRSKIPWPIKALVKEYCVSDVPP